MDSQERELVRQCVMEQIAQHHVESSAVEAAVVSDWALVTELRRIREENRQLRTLLDGIDEGIVILTRDACFVYLNQPAAHVLSRETGIAVDQIIGKTPQEIGVFLHRSAWLGPATRCSRWLF